MKRANIDIRAHASKSGVYLYEVAKKLSLHDSNFSRLLRFELPKEKKTQILTIIDELAREETC